jgi:hypothetical protein
LSRLSGDRVRDEVDAMHRDSEASLFRLGASKAFAQLCARMRALIDGADDAVGEIDLMLAASYRDLNAEFGFALRTSRQPSLDGHRRQLQRIEAGYSRHFGLTRLWRLSESGFLEQFLLVLQSRLRVVFESAATEVETWSKSASAQMESQLRERRVGLQNRREAFQRIQSAEGELERRIAEVEVQDSHWLRLAGRIEVDVEALRALAFSTPRSGVGETGPRLTLVHPLPARKSRGAA